MSNFAFWGWNKKKRTMRKFIKPGDIFCFIYKDDKYIFGRIASHREKIGCFCEIFDYVSDKPVITEDIILNAKWIIGPQFISPYDLFELNGEKEDSEWRIIGHQKNYLPTETEKVYFKFGYENFWKKEDIFGNREPISNEEAELLPLFWPSDNNSIQIFLEPYVK